MEDGPGQNVHHFRGTGEPGDHRREHSLPHGGLDLPQSAETGLQDRLSGRLLPEGGPRGVPNLRSLCGWSQQPPRHRLSLYSGGCRRLQSPLREDLRGQPPGGRSLSKPHSRIGPSGPERWRLLQPHDLPAEDTRFFPLGGHRSQPLQTGQDNLRHQLRQPQGSGRRQRRHGVRRVRLGGGGLSRPGHGLALPPLRPTAREDLRGLRSRKG
ncbi:MAG: hypothetical protein BWY86_01075 [Candidatus Aminicenantes bacterium ADurb.Bin508]|nr:MAG: hypothetical protein BWY86_01075 [Candidatus Aminicenantes bacterium ADurb.Bin508]